MKFQQTYLTKLKIKEKFGKLDVLINNAGVMTNIGRQADIPVDEYLRIMDVNLNGAWYTLKYGVKLIEEGGSGGRVVNVSSLGFNSLLQLNSHLLLLKLLQLVVNLIESACGISGVVYKAGASHYGTSKWGLCGLTKIMALEYAPNKIRINAIAPTGTETEMIKKYIETSPDPEATKAQIAESNPLVGPGLKWVFELE